MSLLLATMLTLALPAVQDARPVISDTNAASVLAGAIGRKDAVLIDRISGGVVEERVAREEGGERINRLVSAELLRRLAGCRTGKVSDGSKAGDWGTVYLFCAALPGSDKCHDAGYGITLIPGAGHYALSMTVINFWSDARCGERKPAVPILPTKPSPQ